MNSSILRRMRCISVREISRLASPHNNAMLLINRPGFVCLANQYRGLKTVHIEWKRPEKIPSVHPRNSGDLEPLPKLDENTVFEEFKDCNLEELSPEQRKMYTLKFLPSVYSYRTVLQQTLSEVQRHRLDCDSMEAQIAKDTMQIRKLQTLWEKFPRNKRQKVALKEIIEKRKSRLNKLRAADYKRFEWLLEKLSLEYRPKPEDNDTVTRKGSYRKLTEEYCEQVKEEKISALKSQLQEERKKFAEERKEITDWIAKEEEICEKLRQANISQQEK